MSKEPSFNKYPECLRRQQELTDLFQSCSSSEQRYQKIIELGKQLPLLPTPLRTEACIVPGCQSQVYLHVELDSQGLLVIRGYSEALISAGLAALLVSVYQGQPPAALFKCPPLFLKEIKILNDLSPTRSNGLANMYVFLQKRIAAFI